LLEFVYSHQPFAIVIGVPHQAAVGVTQIAEHWINESGVKGRKSDEGAAYYALSAFTSLVEKDVPC
jgi:hypothetical protein